MNTPVTLLLLLLLLVLWLYIRRRQARADAGTESPPALSRTDTAYHAVSIKFRNNACKAAQELEGHRFLSTAAPRLPLSECDAAECSCRFVHHKDRRTGNDRRSPFPATGFIAATGNYEQEQRKGRDRRTGDDDY